MSHLTIVANITAAPEKVEWVREQLEKLVGPTRLEPGCIAYDLHQDNGNPAHFMFHETWESRELWQDHLHSDHIQTYRSAAAEINAIADFSLYEMTKIK